MLPRRLRLSRAAFSNTGKEMRVTSPHFSVSVSEGTGAAAIVSKKVEKTSVGRHRIKRRVTSAISPWCSGERRIVVYTRAGAGLLPFAEIERELVPLLTKLLGTPRVR